MLGMWKSLGSWAQHFRQKWSDWSGDREMELAIRRHLTGEGFYGGTAKLSGVRLVAVKRPGWLQIYRFEVTARVAHLEADDEGREPDSETDVARFLGTFDADESLQSQAAATDTAEYRHLYGLVRDDIRHKVNTVRVFATPEERCSLFSRWSEGLICLRGAYSLVTEPKINDPAA